MQWCAHPALHGINCLFTRLSRNPISKQLIERGVAPVHTPETLICRLARQQSTARQTPAAGQASTPVCSRLQRLRVSRCRIPEPQRNPACCSRLPQQTVHAPSQLGRTPARMHQQNTKVSSGTMLLGKPVCWICLSKLTAHPSSQLGQTPAHMHQQHKGQQ